MRSSSVHSLGDAVEDHSGVGWNDPSTGGATVLRWAISECELQNRILDALDYVQEVGSDGVYFGESGEHTSKLGVILDSIAELNNRLLYEGHAASLIMRQP